MMVWARLLCFRADMGPHLCDTKQQLHQGHDSAIVEQDDCHPRGQAARWLQAGGGPRGEAEDGVVHERVHAEVHKQVAGWPEDA